MKQTSPNAKAIDSLERFKKDLREVNSLEGLNQIETKYLGRKGIVNNVLQAMSSLKPEEKKGFGLTINKVKTTVTQLIGVKRTQLAGNEKVDSFIDATLPGKKYPKGSLHLVTYAIEEISKIFAKIGFIRMTYPEVEWEYYSFDALNMPKDEPARDDFETFFVDAPAHPQFGKMVLTPHTSSGQIREMLRLKRPPVRMINIAKCYRPNWDASHIPMFHQFEGMVIDKNINITHLKGTISYFAKEFFGEDRKIRLRPFHFQFTEPSFEVDITCGVCKGRGFVGSSMGETKCKICKAGWLELGGSGMVHPNVLKAANIGPKNYTGWAFGLGVERVMMMKEGLKLDDIRILYNNDIRFLSQF